MAWALGCQVWQRGCTSSPKFWSHDVARKQLEMPMFSFAAQLLLLLQGRTSLSLETIGNITCTLPSTLENLEPEIQYQHPHLLINPYIPQYLMNLQNRNPSALYR